MIPQYNDLVYFIAVAEAGNLSRASERLGVVQPTLSQAVKRLEDVVGVPLLIRQRTGVQLTRAGSILQKQSGALLNSWRFLMNEVKEAELLPKGHFVLGTHPSVALYSLGKFLPRLLADNPLIEVSLVHGLSREILEGVVSSRIDFGLVINARRHPDLVLKKLAEDRVGFWEASGVKAVPDMLIADSSLTQTELLLKKSREALRFTRTIETSSLELVAELVATGAGIGVLPQRVALRHGLKPVFDKSGPWVQDELFLCYRKERQRSIAARKLIDAIIGTKI